ncbi:IS3 family transposase [Flavobacterium hydrophilum]|uniref:IS3 family transposase n=1 Tax=Flavobacterium hydrophilum TaxID=2211445 RepID=A0A2V4BW33_9FLAO|nr:IS3 family transposase [Flavobacterium hydrophilum]PXY43199.1 IS3 family transposase [Flavobacterium hydrophilum]
MEKRKIYDRDFILNAVQMALETNPIKVAKELGIATTNIYRWQAELQKYGTESFCGRGYFRTPEQKRSSELKRKLKELELQIEIFKSASKYIPEGKPMIFHFIKNNLNKYPLWKMCKVLGIEEFTYYRWRDKLLSPKQLQTTLIDKEITSIFYENKGLYGSGKITAELQSRGFKLKECSVSVHMKKLGLVSKLSSRHKTTGSSFIPHNPCIFPNVLNRKFKADEPSQIWISDITSLETVEGLLFLTIIMDLFDRKIVGWNLSEGLTIKETSLPTWEMAIQNRKTKKELVFHSDRSPQYANKIFTRKLNTYKNIIRSMSRTQNHLDNAVAKNFFISLKFELTDLKVLLTKKQMEEKISEYIENLH